MARKDDTITSHFREAKPNGNPLPLDTLIEQAPVNPPGPAKPIPVESEQPPESFDIPIQEKTPADT